MYVGFHLHWIDRNRELKTCALLRVESRVHDFHFETKFGGCSRVKYHCLEFQGYNRSCENVRVLKFIAAPDEVCKGKYLGASLAPRAYEVGY